MKSKPERTIEVTCNFSMFELLETAGFKDLYVDTRGDEPTIREDERGFLEKAEHPHRLVIPSSQALCKFGTIVRMFCNERGIDVSGRPTLFLKECGMWEEFCDFKASVLCRKFDSWCRDNNVRFIFE